ncbi:MAG: hypothetical protein AAGN66_26645 [Acidobacteriota bacterium]
MHSKKLFALVGSIALLLVTISCDASVNKSIRIGDGETSTGGLSSVNGSIRIGTGATVRGDAETVNGGVDVGDQAKVGDVGTVNGSIDVGTDVVVDGAVESVNGSVKCDRGTVVRRDVETVNGSIKLAGTTVEGKIETVNGTIVLDRGTRVVGDVIIQKSRGWGGNRRKALEIHVRDGSVIEGDVIARGSKRPVVVRLEGGGRVNGEIRGAEVIER